jgi:hypothetical protein
MEERRWKMEAKYKNILVGEGFRSAGAIPNLKHPAVDLAESLRS